MLAEPWQRLSRIGRCAGRVYRMNHGKEEKKEKVQASWGIVLRAVLEHCDEKGHGAL